MKGFASPLYSIHPRWFQDSALEQKVCHVILDSGDNGVSMASIAIAAVWCLVISINC